jgi:hypothetical protein
LAEELSRALPRLERATYFTNRSIGWCQRDSAAHYMLRFATGMTVFVTALFFCLILVVVFLKDGWDTTLILARPIAGMVPFMFIDSFLLGLLYFKLRDAMCGAPWARRSLPQAIGWGGLIAAVTFGTALAFNALAQVDRSVAARALVISITIAAVAAIIFPVVASTSGPDEIGDAIWAGLDLDESKPEVA